MSASLRDRPRHMCSHSASAGNQHDFVAQLHIRVSRQSWRACPSHCRPKGRPATDSLVSHVRRQVVAGRRDSRSRRTRAPSRFKAEAYRFIVDNAALRVFADTGILEARGVIRAIATRFFGQALKRGEAGIPADPSSLRLMTMRFTVRCGANPRFAGPQSRTRCALLLSVWFLGAILIGAGGCGGGKTAKPEAEVASEGKAKSAKTDAEPSEAEEDVADAKPAKSKSAAKKAEIDGIPLDVVWFDDPLAVAADSTAVGGAAPAVAAAAPPKPATGGAMSGGSSAPPPPPAAAPAASGSGEWGELVTLETVVNETKKIKNRLTDSLVNVGKYNGNYKDGIQMDGAVLATLAHIVPKLEGSLTWKGDAPVVRDLAADVAKKANGLGQASFDPRDRHSTSSKACSAATSPRGWKTLPPSCRSANSPNGLPS